MNTPKPPAGQALRGLAAALLAACSFAAAAQQAVPASPPPDDVERLAATFNDETIPFNDRLIVLGKADAPLTAVLIFGLSGDTNHFMERMFPAIKEKYIDNGRMRLVVYDFPLTWHDMQALAGFRCLPAEQHFAVLQDAVRYTSFADGMKRASYLDAPSHVWKLLKKYDIPRDKAEKCMRNNPIIGHIEALRRTATQSWRIRMAPSLIIGDRVLHNPSALGYIEDILNVELKGGK